MTETEELLDELAAGTEVLLQTLDGVTDAARKPAPDRWSVLETVEHVAVVEEYLLARLLEAVDATEPAGSPAREGKIRRFAPPRLRPVTAPEMLVPTGRYATVDEALCAFRSHRAETTRFVEGVTGGLQAKGGVPPL